MGKERLGRSLEGKGPGERLSVRRWGRSESVSFIITSIYCAPTLCSALYSVSGTPNCIESSPLGVTGMVHIVHFIDEGMKLTHSRSHIGES